MSRRGEIHAKPSFSARQRMSQGQKGKRVPPRTLEQRKHLSEIQSEMADHYRQKALEQWQNPEIRDKQTKAILSGSHIRPTKAEYELEILIEIACSKEYKYVGDGKVIIGGMCPDFINILGKKKVIEMFGDYWHKGQDPQDKINKYKTFGFECLVIWESDLTRLSKLELLTMIKKFNSIENNAPENITETFIPKQLNLF